MYLLTTIEGAATNAEEEVGWDEDSDEEDAKASGEIEGSTGTLGKKESPSASATPTKAEAKQKSKLPARLEPPRPHDVLSQPDSDASYDLVSAATSRAGGSPKDVKTIDEESDEDWE